MERVHEHAAKFETEIIDHQQSGSAKSSFRLTGDSAEYTCDALIARPALRALSGAAIGKAFKEARRFRIRNLRRFFYCRNRKCGGDRRRQHRG